MFTELMSQLATRGDLPCLCGGDYNTELDASPPLRHALSAKFLPDARHLTDDERYNKPTYHSKTAFAGTKIDHILISTAALSLFGGFHVMETPAFRAHCAVVKSLTQVVMSVFREGHSCFSSLHVDGTLSTMA